MVVVVVVIIVFVRALFARSIVDDGDVHHGKTIGNFARDWSARSDNRVAVARAWRA